MGRTGSAAPGSAQSSASRTASPPAPGKQAYPAPSHQTALIRSALFSFHVFDRALKPHTITTTYGRYEPDLVESVAEGSDKRRRKKAVRERPTKGSPCSPGRHSHGSADGRRCTQQIGRS